MNDEVREVVMVDPPGIWAWAKAAANGALTAIAAAAPAALIKSRRTTWVIARNLRLLMAAPAHAGAACAQSYAALGRHDLEKIAESLSFVIAGLVPAIPIKSTAVPY
jgi:hypothetical protein